MSDIKVQGVVEMSSESAERALNRVGTVAEGMAKKVEGSADKAGKAVDNIGSCAGKSADEFTRAEGKIVNSIKRATTQLEQLGKTASQKLELRIADKGLDAAKFEPALAKLRELEAAQSRVVTSSRSFGGGLQNTSYQLQDFIVQVNGGTDATRALSMQLPQMLVGFGAAGAAIGVVAALLPNLIQAFGNAGESSKKFSDAMSDFDKAIGDVGSTVKEFDMEKLYEQFNQSSDAVRNATIEQLRFQQEYIKTTQLVASKKFGESLGGFGEFTTLDKLSGSFNGAEKLAKQLGVSVETAKDLMPVLRGLKSGSEDVNLAFNRFGTALLGGNAKAVELAQTMATLSKSERDAAAASSALSEAQDKMAKGRVTTKKEADDAAKAAKTQAEALNTLLDSINGKSADFDSNYVKNVETLLTAYDKGKLSLSGFNEVFSRYVAMQPGAVAATAEWRKQLEKAEESVAKGRQNMYEQIRDAERQAEMYGLTASQISAIEQARLSEAIAIAQQNGASEEQIAFLQEELALRAQLTDELIKSDEKKINEQNTKALEKQKSALEELGITFTSAFENAISGGQGWSAVLKGIEQDLVRLIIRMTVTENVAKSLKSVMDSGSLGKMFSSWFSGSSQSSSEMAVGADINSAGLGGYAKGDVFVNSPSLSAYSGGVYDQPKFFQFASGAGVFAEAGPEAIIPLKRGPDGKLGVSSDGSGSVTVNVYNESGSTARTERRSDGRGGSVIDVFIEQVKGAIAGDIASGNGAVPSAMERTYGMRRMAGAY